MTTIDRRSGIGASEVAAAVGVDPFCSRYELWLLKTGRRIDPLPTDAMTLGIAQETWVLAKWCLCHPEFRPAGSQMRLPVQTLQAPMWATCDLVVQDSEGRRFPVEAKTTTWRNAGLGDEGTDQLPLPWLCQMQIQAAAVGASRGYFGVLIDGANYREYEVAADQAIQNKLFAKCGEFWQYVASDRTPPADWSVNVDEQLDRYRWIDEQPTAADLRTMAPTWAEYQMIGERIADLERQRDEAKRRLLSALGDHHRGTLDGDRELVVHQTNRAGYTVLPTSYMRLAVRKVPK